MNIAVIGTGAMGRALARVWANAGHQIWLGSRDRDRGARVALQLGAPAASVHGGEVAEAVACCAVAVLAVPWPAVHDTIGVARETLESKVLIDCTNPLIGARKPLAVGRTTSGAEEVAALAPRARVVKAFNAISARVIASGDPSFNGSPATILLCGDDPDARSITARLISDCGFRALDAGGLNVSRHLEPLAALTLLLDCAEGPGFDLVLQPTSRPRDTSNDARRA